MPESVFDLFSGLSVEFDSRYQNDPNFVERLQCWTALIDKYLVPGQVVYDLGCGPGVFSFYTASKGGQVTGIDGSAGMISLCREKLARMPGPPLPVRFVQDTLPLENPAALPKAGLILCSSMFEYIQDKHKMAACFRDLMDDNGVLLLSVPNRGSWYRSMERLAHKLVRRPAYLAHVHHRFSQSELNKFMSGYGFVALETKYYADQYVLSGLLRSFLPPRLTHNLLLTAFRLQKKK